MAFWKKSPEEKKQEAQKQEGLKAANLSSPALKTAGIPPKEDSASASVPLRGPEDRLSERYGKIRSALGPGTVIQGRLSFDAVVRIDGKLQGEVFSSKPLIVGPTGQIDAQIEVASLVVLGLVKGKVKATEKIEVWADGRLEADVATPSITIEEGAVFSGSCTMPAKNAGAGRK